jgi:hypothetical protein
LPLATLLFNSHYAAALILAGPMADRPVACR